MEITEPEKPPGEISDAEHLRIFLHDRDVECPLCQYNLRGQAAGRCPECGRELRLSVGLTEPFLRAWIALVFPAFASAGIGVLFLGMIFAGGLPPARAMAPVFYFVLGGPVLAAITILRRKGFLKLSISVQWRIATIVACLSTIAMIAFLAMVR